MTGEATTNSVETNDEITPEESTALTGDPVVDDPAKKGEGDDKTGDDKTGDDKAGDDKAGDDKTGDDKAGDDKAGDDKAGDDKAGDEFTDFQTPDGMEIDKTLLDKATPLFKELNLNQESAQKLVSLYAEHAAENAQNQVDQFNQMKDEWLNEAKSDKEIGGDKFDENVADARVALNKFGTPELKTLLNKFGIGNNAEVIRFMARVGKLTKEDDPGSTGTNRSEKTDRVSTLYPNETK